MMPEKWHIRRTIILFFIFLSFANPAFSFDLHHPECIAPAKPGGGFDIMCHLLATSLADALSIKMSIRYEPGGIGALAYNYVISVKNKDPNIIVTASTGSALNLALHKFGKYTEDDVRWVAAVGADYGAVTVRADAPWKNLDDLVAALEKNPSGPIFGAAGSIGSQDWMGVALTLTKAGVDPKKIRYISYEGGGEAVHALLKGYIQIFPGDISEVDNYLNNGRLRVLAVFAKKRLPGKYSHIPTAVEQGYDVVWPVWRGYYLPPGISNEEYRWWTNTLYRLTETDVFKKEREKLHLFPLTLVGDEFDRYVKEDVRRLRETAEKLGLVAQ
jgi:putative tricarboxylic transport membrane protein